MCYTSLKEAVEEKGDGAGTKSNQKSAAQLRSNPGFQALMTEIEGQNNRTGGPGPHPKMEQLKTLLVQHFGSRMSDEQDGEEQETRAMVFVTNRGCVDEIVDMLNNDRPLLRATKFIGQGTDKQGKKGFAQKEQLQVFSGAFLSKNALILDFGRSSKNSRTENTMSLFPHLLARKVLISEKLT